jgi:hypothetical protein
VAGLGGDGGAGGGGGEGGGSPMPGPLGSPQASLQDLAMSVEQLKSQGPDLMDHYRSANALVADDSAGGQKLYLQAQKELYETIKGNLVGSVGQNRAWTILGNDTTKVQHYQATEVGDDRSVSVGGKQSHFVKGEMTVQCQSNITTITPKGGMYSIAKTDIDFAAEREIKGMSDNKIELKVGASTILMKPDGIAIDAQDVYINPGKTFMEEVAKGSKMKDAQKKQQEHEEAINKQIKANNDKIAELQDHVDTLKMSLDNVPPQYRTGGIQGEIDRTQTQIDGLNQQNAALKKAL